MIFLGGQFILWSLSGLYMVTMDLDFIHGDHLVKVNYNDVTAEDLNADRFPYVLQQRSGEGNALGNMKFMMPNQWNIYIVRWFY